MARTTPRYQSRTYYQALGVATCSEALGYTAGIAGGLSVGWAALWAFGFAVLVGHGVYRGLLGPSEDLTPKSAKGGKKRAKAAPEVAASPTWMEPFYQRWAALLVAVGILQYWVVVTWLSPAEGDAAAVIPIWPAVIALGASALLLAWGGRFWLQVLQPTAPILAGWQQRVRDYGPAVLCMVCTCAMLYHQVPTLFQSGEMWSDAATNYFKFAHYDGLWANVVAKDTGYMPWAARFFAVLVALFHVPAVWVPFVYQGIALVAIGALTAAFALPQCRSIVPSDAARFLVCRALACEPDYDLKSFINFPYYAAIVVFILLWTLPRKKIFHGGTRFGPGFSWPGWV